MVCIIHVLKQDCIYLVKNEEIKKGPTIFFLVFLELACEPGPPPHFLLYKICM